MDLNFIFKSPDHLRYENGNHVSGPHGGAARAIKVETNASGEETYSVTIYNLDGNHAVWQNNVQMASKPMKIVKKTNEKIVLRGYGQDMMGGQFSDYGLTVHFLERQVSKCVLHMYDRAVDIEYLKGEEDFKSEPEFVVLSRRANAQYQSENVTDGRQLLSQIYRTIKHDPIQLQNVKDFSSLGVSFLMMLDQGLSDDIDALQTMASIGYLCISKAIENDSSNINLYKDRLLMLRVGHEPFTFTVISALKLNSRGLMSFEASMSSFAARDAIYKMEIADLELHPPLYKQIPYFRERKIEFDEMIARQFFKPEISVDKIVESGRQNHKRLLDYLTNRVIVEGNVDF